MNTETTNPCLDDSELLKEIIERTKKMERDIARILGERSEQD